MVILIGRMVSSTRIEIEKFNGCNFELWKLKMEDLLVDQEQWITMDPKNALTGMLKEEWDKVNRKERSMI